MTFIFHPHGWIKPEQMVEFIDYAVTKYGKRVKFLNFREAQERLAGMLEGRTAPVREIGEEGRSRIARLSSDVRLIDINGDGFLDMLLGQGKRLEISTLLWNAEKQQWSRRNLPFLLGRFLPSGQCVRIQFGVVEHTVV